MKRRAYLAGLATAAAGLAGCVGQSTNNRSAAQNIGSTTATRQTTQPREPRMPPTTEQSDQPPAPDIHVQTMDADPEYDPNAYNTYFEDGDVLWGYAQTYNINHDNSIRIAYQWNVVGGGGLYHQSEGELFTYTEYDGWRFWTEIDTYYESSEGRVWTDGEYTISLTVTDFITGLASSESSTFYL